MEQADKKECPQFSVLTESKVVLHERKMNGLREACKELRKVSDFGKEMYSCISQFGQKGEELPVEEVAHWCGTIDTVFVALRNVLYYIKSQNDLF